MGINMLWIDDDPVEHELMRRVVEQCAGRINVAPCHDGPEALALASGRLGVCPPLDLVLLDLLMPNQHGLEVLALLKKDPVTRVLPVIVYSNHSVRSDVLKAYELGAALYVVKPADFSSTCEFMGLLERLCTGFVTLPRAEPN